MESQELVTRLRALRRSIRRRLVAFGVFAVFGGGAIALLTVIALDWFLWLPPALRVLGGVFFVLGFFAAMFYWIVQPLRARLGLDEIAAHVERHFVPLRDRLSSSVNFLERSDGASEELVREVIADTERVVRQTPLESVLSSVPVATRGSLFGVSMVVLLVLLVIAPQWIRTGVQRYVSPWDSAEWPRWVTIVPVSGDKVVPVGESATVTMRVAHGLRDSLRGVVHLHSPGGATHRVALRREADGTFSTTVDGITEDLEYWFEAGDDTTRDRPATIRVVHRPEVVEALATLRPPPYATGLPPRTEVLTAGDAGMRRSAPRREPGLGPASGTVTAIVGSHVSVAVQASKPVVTGAQDTGLRFENGEFAPLVPSATDPQTLAADFELTGDAAFRVELHDEHGFRNRRPATFKVSARPDAPPSVALLRPVGMIEATPRSTVEMEARVIDDLGIRSARLLADRGGDTEMIDVDLTDRLNATATADGITATARWDWRLYELPLSPGDVLGYELVAWDNHRAAGDARARPALPAGDARDRPALPAGAGSGDNEGQVGRSTPGQIRIISEAEFELRMREEIVALEARIRQAVLEQEELRGRTDALTRLADRAAGLKPRDVSMAGSLSLAQSRLARRLGELSGGFAGLAEQTRQNLPNDEAGPRRLTDIADALRAVADGTVAEAESRLAATRHIEDPAAQHDSLEEAVAAQDATVRQLRSLLRNVSEWGSFQGVVSRTRDLLDRQTKLLRETTRVGQETLGKSADALSPAEAESVARAGRQQEQLARDVEGHLARMRELAESVRPKQPASADAVDAAVRAARAEQLDRRLRTAAEAISENRTAAATVEQRAAADAMRRMLSALREREKRELEELRKRLNEAKEQVAWLIEHQQSIFAATTEATAVAAEARTFRSLENEQRTLARNTSATGEELAATDRAAGAARYVRQAVGPMEKAGFRLGDALADTALDAQQEALALLRQALAELEHLDQEAAEQALRNTLEHIQDGLEAALDAQLRINGGVVELEGVVRERGQLGRAENRKAAKLARNQSDARGMIEALLDELQQVPVYEWALQRAGRWMVESRDALNARRIDADLLRTTERIAAELETLVGAIRETLTRPIDVEFAEAETTGGSSGGQASAQAGVPTMAELLVLKAMQQQINERTRDFADGYDPATAREARLRELVTIAEDQAEVRRLTELVTEKARSAP